MKVLVIHNLKRGGAWRRLGEQVSRLDAEVVELTLETAAPVTGAPHVISLTARAPRQRRAFRPPLRYADAVGLALAWRRLSLAARRLQPDVIFANPCQFLQAPPALLSSAIPALYFCDEPRRVDYEPEAAATRNPRTRGLYAPIYAYERRLDAASVRHTAKLATNSRYTASCIHESYGVDADVIPMGVADAFLRGALDRPREDFVLSVGSLTSAKGHDLAIRAVSRSRKLHSLVIVSPRADADEEARLGALANELGVALDLRVGITDDELRATYERARVTACLSRAEPFGLAALEAQACGSPVVASADGGLREVVVDRVTGFGVAREPAAVAEAFDAVCEPDISARMQIAAAAHGRARSWDASARRVQTLLEEVGRTP